MKVILTILLGFSLWTTPNTTRPEPLAQANGDLVVSVKNLKNTKGQIGILVFDKKEGFPGDRPKALRDILLPIEGASLEYTFEGLPYGDYAVSIMHDENKNKKLDKNLLGIPKEGNGVSNNVVNKMGPPKYEKAVFQLNQASHTIQIKVRY